MAINHRTGDYFEADQVGPFFVVPEDVDVQDNDEIEVTIVVGRVLPFREGYKRVIPKQR